MSNSSPSTSNSAGAKPSAQSATASSKADTKAGFSADKKAGSAQQSCPLCKKGLCDIQSLTVTDTVSGRKVVAKVRAGKRPVKAAPVGAPKRAATLYPAHDFILELSADCHETASDPSSGPSPDAKRTAPAKASAPKVVQLQVQAAYVGTCVGKDHPLLSLNPVSNSSDANKEWKVLAPPSVKLLSMPGPGDPGGPPRQWAKKWISPFWFSDDVKELEVAAYSCGTRASGEPNNTLKGLVRIYRNDVYSLSCKIPPFAKYKAEKSKQLDGKGGVENKTSSSTSVAGREMSASSSSNSSNLRTGEYSHKTSESGKIGGTMWQRTDEVGFKEGKAFDSTSNSFTDRSGPPSLFTTSKTDSFSATVTGASAKLVEEKETSRELNAAVSLKRNGHELEFTKFVNDIINLQQRITKAWNDIKNWVPKVGWTFTFEISILEGTITGEWGQRAVDTGKAEDALWVDRFYNIKFDCKVLAYKAEIALGVDFSIPDLLSWFGDGKLFELVLQAAGSLEGEAKIQATLCGADKSEPLQINGNSVMKFEVRGKVTALGVTCEAKGGVTGGIQLDGVLEGSIIKEPSITARVFFIETKIYAYYVNEMSRNKRSKTYSQAIFDEKTIWSGSLLNDNSNP